MRVEGAKMEGDPAKEKEKFGPIVLEIGPGSPHSTNSLPWLSVEANKEKYKNAHIIKLDVLTGGESDEEKLRVGGGHGRLPENSSVHEHKGKYPSGGWANLRYLRDVDDHILRNLKKDGYEFSGQIDYIKADAQNIPLQDASVDEVFAKNVFGAPFSWNVADSQNFINKREWFMDNMAEQVLPQIARVLKNGGELVLAEDLTPESLLGRPLNYYNEMFNKDVKRGMEVVNFDVERLKKRIKRFGLDLSEYEILTRLELSQMDSEGEMAKKYPITNRANAYLVERNKMHEIESKFILTLIFKKK